MHHKTRRTCARWGAFLVVALCALCWDRPAQARQMPLPTSGRQTPSSPDAPGVFVSFGYANSMTFWPNRWAPITVTLTSPARPEPFEGMLVLTYPQDGSLNAKVVRPVVCTPGKVTTCQIMVNVSRGASEFTVTLLDKGGRDVAKQRYTPFTSGDPWALHLPDVTASGDGVAWGVGATSGAARSIVYASDQLRGQSAFGASGVQCVTSDAQTLPMSWTGYDSLLLLAVDAEVLAKADPRISAAIREWVSSGGRLVVFVNQAGSDWEQILPSESPFRVQEPTTGPVSDELNAVLVAPVATFVTAQKRALQNFNNGVPMPEEAIAAAAQVGAEGAGALDPSDPDNTARDPSVSPRPAEPAPPADSRPPQATRAAQRASQRVIELTEEGIARGWSVKWRAPGDGSSDPAAPVSRGLLAEGPHGFGWIVVVGLDPGSAAELGSPEGTRAVWASITDRCLLDWRQRMIAPKSSASNPYNYNPVYSTPSMTAPGDIAGSAKAAILNRLADVPMFGNDIFYVLGAGLLLLAILIGPFDALVLRKLKARQHSWGTSLVWIALAAVLAYWLPMLLRSGPTRVNRVSTVDAIMPAGVSSTPSIAWTSGWTGVYASATTESSLIDPDLMNSGQWWRGASAQTYYYYGGRRSSATTNLFTQSMPDFSSLAGSELGNPGSAANLKGAGGNPLLPGTFKVWTFRLFMDQQRTAWPVGARIEARADAPGELSLRLMGLPKDAEVRRVGVCIGGRWFNVSHAELVAMHAARSNDDTAIGVLPMKPAHAVASENVWLGVSRDAILGRGTRDYNLPYGAVQYQSEAEITKRPGAVCDLAGPDRRTHLINSVCDAAPAMSGYAVVFLHLRDMPTGLQFEGETSYQHDTIARILVPIDAALAASATRLSPPVVAPTAPASSETTTEDETGETP